MQMRTWVSITVVIAALAVAGAASGSVAQKRLNKAQWTTYTKAHTVFTTTTNRVVATFRRCRNTQAYKDARHLIICIGSTPSQEILATQIFEAHLHPLVGKTAGACDASLGALLGKLQLWRFAVIGVKRAVQTSGVTASNIDDQAGHAVIAYQGVTGASTTVVKDCKPLGV
jgi:hypothetical protein